MRLRLPHKRAPRNQAGARRETLGRIGFRAVREGGKVIASNACFGLIPLRCIFFGSAESGRRAQGNSRKDRFSRCARGGEGDRFQCLLRPDPAPLYFFWLRGIRPARAGKLWEG